MDKDTTTPWANNCKSCLELLHEIERLKNSCQSLAQNNEKNIERNYSLSSELIEQDKKIQKLEEALEKAINSSSI